LLAKNKLHQQRYEYGNNQAEENFLDEGGDSEKNSIDEDDKKCIQDAIAKMKDDERDMILLRFTSELSLDEIAKVIDKKLSATKMSFYRALEKFKTLYEKYCL
jgi:RNA polymerase sigma-70 factor (ECF subfamily)